MRRRGLEIRGATISFDPITLTFLVYSVVLLFYVLIFDTRAILQLMFAFFGLVYAMGMGGYTPWIGRHEVYYSVLVGVLGALGIVVIDFLLGFFGRLEGEFLPVIYTLTAPFVEEAFFRGFLLNFQLGFVPLNPVGISIAFTSNSLVFAVYHVGSSLLLFHSINFIYLCAIYASGYLLCYEAYVTKRLIAPMFTHFLINVIALKGLLRVI